VWSLSSISCIFHFSGVAERGGAPIASSHPLTSWRTSRRPHSILLARATTPQQQFQIGTAIFASSHYSHGTFLHSSTCHCARRRCRRESSQCRISSLSLHNSVRRRTTSSSAADTRTNKKDYVVHSVQQELRFSRRGWWHNKEER
jgi:hypothetical protein